MIPAIVHKRYIADAPDVWDERRLGDIARRLNPDRVCPVPGKIFRAFAMDPLDVKCILVGLSPYKNKYQGEIEANGLAFGSHHLTPSLRVIRDAVRADYGEDREIDLSMEHWHNQGVLLLNAALSVDLHGDAKGHLLIWRNWMRDLIASYAPHIPVALLGADAGQFSLSVRGPRLKTCHPAATARWIRSGQYAEDIPEHLDFRKYGLFRKLNEILEAGGVTPVKWHL